MKKSKKFYIDACEEYPVYVLVEPREKLGEYFKITRPLVKIPEKKLKWIRKVEKEYAKMQEYLEKLELKMLEKMK